MTKSFVRAISGIAIVGALSGAASAATDFYLKLEGIDGEPKAAGHGGSLEVASWSFGASNPSTVGPGSSGATGRQMGGAPAAEPTHGSSGALTITKVYDKASPVLAKACASGQVIRSAQLKRCQDGTCRSYELKDVVISGFALANDGRGGVTESLSLNYSKVELEYKPQNDKRESPSRPSQGGSTPVQPKPL
jgi:type VI secretion system secreted protein Hcp